MRCVLITGAAGFIGSHLVDRYFADGVDVIAVDNFLTGRPANLAHIRSSKRYAFVEHDVTCDFSAIEPAVERVGRPDLVLHFASPASPVDYGRFPRETMRVNSLGTENAVTAALHWGARFLFASTSEAYGDPAVHPQPESYWGNVNPIGPRSCYDESKRYGEAMVSTFAREGADVRLIRIFNTYGPRMALDDGRVVPNFIKQALLGQPLTVYGDGKQTRSFCYVSDLVEGIVRCADSPETRGVVVNLGNPREETVASFGRLVAENAGVPFTIEYRPLPPDDPTRRCPDISRARELLDWQPVVDLEEGLRKTIDHFREVLKTG